MKGIRAGYIAEILVIYLIMDELISTLQFVQFRGDAVVFTSPLNRLILGVLRGHLVLVGDGLICVVSIVGAAADNE